MADNYDDYSREELLRELRLRDRRPRFGLVWERKEIEHEKAVNDDFVALDFDPALSCGEAPYRNLIIEGDNFDALRYLRMTHAGKVKLIDNIIAGALPKAVNTVTEATPILIARIISAARKR
jgi:adenine-specific DNA-methyltransferase